MDIRSPRLMLRTLWVIGRGNFWLSLNRAQVLSLSVILLELLAGASLAVLFWLGSWWLKLLAGLLFLGFVFAGVQALGLIRKAEQRELVDALAGLLEDQLRSRVYFEEPETELGRVGLLLNQLIEHSEDRLEKQRRLIGAISHDLRTPLTILRGDMEVALLRQRSPEEYQEILRSNLEEIDRISRLVEDLLLVSKAEAGELKMIFRTVDLSQLLMGLYADYKKIALKKGLDLTIDAESGIILKIDQDRVKQLVANLIENAIAYTPVGRRIELSLKRRDKEAWLMVRDQGMGIPSEELPHIFEPFYRGKEAKRLASKGYGLGLSICKQIANAHNGEIEVETRVGPESGTSFKVRLPL